MSRPTWKGTLKVSLVTIPIKVFPATESSEPSSFHQLHATCQTRMQQRRWCQTCGCEVASADVVKGFEFEPGKFVILQPDELDAVQPPSTKVIDLVTFADAAALDPICIDRSYYVAPDGPSADEAFVTLREGMRGQVGIGKLAIYGREYLVAVRPHQALLLLHTLHHAAEIRPLHALDDWARVVDVPDPSPQRLKLARSVIAALHGPLDLAGFTDGYRADLQRLIAAKIAGQEIVEATYVETPRMESLNTALMKSLDLAKKKIPAKATAPPKKRAS